MKKTTKNQWGGARKRVEVIDLRTGIKYRSINEASADLGISTHSFSTAKERNMDKVVGVPVVFIDTECEARERMIQCVDTGEIFNSMRKAERKYNNLLAKSTNLSYAMKNKNGMAYGMKWRFVDE